MHDDPPWRVWINTVDSCVSILGLPGTETHTLTHRGRSRVGMGCNQEPLICRKPHNTTIPPSTDSTLCFNVCTHTHFQSALKPPLQSLSPHALPHLVPEPQEEAALHVQQSLAAEAFSWGRDPEISGLSSWRTIHAVILF